MQQKILKWSLLAAIVCVIFDALFCGCQSLLRCIWYNSSVDGIFFYIYIVSWYMGYIQPFVNDIFQIFLMVAGGAFVYMNRKNILPMVGGGLIIFQGLMAVLTNLLVFVFYNALWNGYPIGGVLLLCRVVEWIILIAAFVVLSFHYKDKVMGVITAVFAVVKSVMIILLIMDLALIFMYRPWGIVIFGVQGILVLAAEVAFLYFWFRKINEPQLTD